MAERGSNSAAPTDTSGEICCAEAPPDVAMVMWTLDEHPDTQERGVRERQSQTACDTHTRARGHARKELMVLQQLPSRQERTEA